MAKKFVSNDKDQHRLKAQREKIIELQREIKLLEQKIRTLEKALNRPEKEAVPVIKKVKLTPAEEREATRKKFANFGKTNSEGTE